MSQSDNKSPIMYKKASISQKNYNNLYEPVEGYKPKPKELLQEAIASVEFQRNSLDSLWRAQRKEYLKARAEMKLPPPSNVGLLAPQYMLTETRRNAHSRQLEVLQLKLERLELIETVETLVEQSEILHRKLEEHFAAEGTSDWTAHQGTAGGES